MKNLSRIINEQDEWVTAEGIDDDKPFLLRFRPHLHKFIETKKYNDRYTIACSYTSINSSSLPSNTDIDLMGKFEDMLVESLEKDLQCVLAFVFTGSNKREWQLYSTNPMLTESRVKKILPKFKLFSFETSSKSDNNWEEYLSVLGGTQETDD